MWIQYGIVSDFIDDRFPVKAYQYTNIQKKLDEIAIDSTDNMGVLYLKQPTSSKSALEERYEQVQPDSE